MKKSKINECLRKRLLFSQEPVYIRTFWSKKEKSERIIEWKRFHAQVRKIVNTFARLPKKYQSFARLPVCPNFKIFSFALLCFSWKRENVFIHFHDFHLLDHPCLQPDCIPYFLKICRIKVIKLILFVESKISINISFTYIFDYYAEYLKWILDSSFDLSNVGYNFRCLTLERSECRKLWDWYITISLIFWLFAQTLIIRPFSIL